LDLKTTDIRFTDREDELAWIHAEHETYTPKKGYVHLNLELLHRNPNWWWKGLWKSK
jgi:hypothetical protein